MSLRFVLVYRTGGQYKEWHVRRLMAQLREYCSKRFEIHVITDDWSFEKPMTDETIITHYVSTNVASWFPGWWLKLLMFHRGVILPGHRYLYFDLDTTIVANIDRLVSRVIEADDKFIILEDVYRGHRHYQSSIMAFSPSPWLNEIYASYVRNATDTQELFQVGGDQEYIQYCVALVGKFSDTVYFQDMLPDNVVSYKVHCPRGRAPAGASVVIYHGQPKPWDEEGRLYA